MQPVILALCFSFPFVAAAATRPTNVILISIDGLRGDAVTPDLAPRLTGLASRGAATFAARSLWPTYTIPNHVSMLTGLTPATHGIVAIVDAGDIEVDGTIAEILHAAGMKTGIYLAKDKLDILARPGVTDRYFVSTSGSSGGAVAALTADLAAAGDRPNFAFLHLTEPDTAGHRDGWGSVAYDEAVRTADGFVGRVLDEIDRQGLAADTLIIVTADHGGIGFNHGDLVREVVEVPWIAAGPSVPAGLAIAGRVEMHDTAPTILAALDVPAPGAMEGKVIVEALAARTLLLRRGDVDANGAVDIADAIALFRHGFEGMPAPCPASGDANEDLRLDLTDCIVLLDHLLRGGPPLPEPYPNCGVWPSRIEPPCAASPCR
jgi:predicted AlkP superfamily pyrophosphatase or phosphodiesterase